MCDYYLNVKLAILECGLVMSILVIQHYERQNSLSLC